MARTIEDLSEEVVTLRNSDREGWQKVSEQRTEIATLTKELEWWKKTFGPESTQ